MARYTGPKARINRRLGTMVYENAGPRRVKERRGDQPPGMHIRRKRPSNYGMGLMEKQKIKHYYGIGERQLRRYFKRASSGVGNTGEKLLLICENRLDNVIRRIGLAVTRPQARQGIVHGHFKVNGVKVDKPSYQLRPGDVITVKPNEKLKVMYQGLASISEGEGIEWVSYDSESLTATVQGKPGPSDISLPLDMNMVIEFMSR